LLFVYVEDDFYWKLHIMKNESCRCSSSEEKLPNTLIHKSHLLFCRKFHNPRLG